MLNLLLDYTMKLPWIHNRDQARYFVRVYGMLNAGALVWLIIAYELYWFAYFGADSSQHVIIALSLWAAFTVLFLIAAWCQALSYIGISSRHYSEFKYHVPSIIMVTVLYALSVGLSAVAGYGGVEPEYLMLSTLMIAPMAQALWWPIAMGLMLSANVTASLFYPELELTAVFYLILQQLVLMVMVRAQINEQASKDALARRNDELQATQSLLGEASRQNERLRIARNIHDVAGHHITALSLHLEMLSHKTQGDVQEDVTKAQSITQSLLNEVRNAVSEYRMDASLPIVDMLKELTSHAPGLDIDLDIDDTLTIRDADMAECVLRCTQELVTNTLKHSHADSLFIQIQKIKGALKLIAIDNGTGANTPTLFRPGNGLNGMRERVESLGGTLSFGSEDTEGFKVQIHLPVQGDKL